MPRTSFSALALAAISLLAPFSKAQPLCGMAWDPGFSAPGVIGPVSSAETFDDGTGPAAYLSAYWGYHLVRYDGTTFTEVDTFNSVITDLHVHDDGTGPALYLAGGSDLLGAPPIRCVAKRVGSSWVQLGSGLVGSSFLQSAYVRRLITHDDGTGPALYAIGTFELASSPGVIRHVARWNGTVWSALPADFPDIPEDAVSWDDGSGPALFVSGHTNTSNRTPVVRKWTGSSWILLGSFPTLSLNSAKCLAVHDDGSGPSLYAGGELLGFGSSVAKWSGSAWLPVGSGFAATFGYPDVVDLVSFDAGSGPRLYAVGNFSSIAGQPRRGFAGWDGSAWSQPFSVDGYAAFPSLLEVVSHAGPPWLLIAGKFEGAGGIGTSNAAFWDGASVIGFLGGNGTTGDVYALGFADDGTGPAVYASGWFKFAGVQHVGGIARWSGATWDAVGSGTTPNTYENVEAFAGYDDGTGPAVYAGGSFTSISGVPVAAIARLRQGVWSAVGTGLDASNYIAVNALHVHDDGSGNALYVGGIFSGPVGISSPHIARWTPAGWQPVGGGLPGFVWSLTTHDDGSGPALYAAGWHGAAALAGYVAKWTGTTWSELPPPAVFHKGFQQIVSFDDGSGSVLWAVPDYGIIGPYGPRVMRWNGTTWDFPEAGLAPYHLKWLQVFDDGTGPKLLAFVEGPDGMRTWNGTSWDVIPGSPHRVWTSVVESSESGPTLWVGGSFTSSTGFPGSNIARLRLQGPGILSSQAGPGAPVTDWNTGLVPGREYFDVFSFEPCTLGPGSGPYAGLCATDPQVLISQLFLPAGFLPFRPIATATMVPLGSYPLPPGLVIEATVLETTAGVITCRSPVRRIHVR